MTRLTTGQSLFMSIACCPHQGTEIGSPLPGDNFFADIPATAESILTTNNHEATRGIPGHPEHALEHTGFFIGEKKKSPIEEH